MDLSFLSGPVPWLINQVQKYGFGFVFKRYPGIYKAKVVDVDDPENRGRVKLIVPAIGQVEDKDAPAVWAEPCMTGLSAGDSATHGVFFPPDVNDQVWAMFQQGDPGYPVYVGGWLRTDPGGDEVKASTDSAFKGLRTKSGHYLRFSDLDGDVHVTISKGDGEGSQSGALISLTDDGSILMGSDSGAHVWINEANSKVQVMSNDGTSIQVGDGAVTMITGTGKATFNLKDDKLDIQCNGSIIMTSGAKIVLNSKSVELGANAVEPAVLGGKHLIWAQSHGHATASPGSPTVPGTTVPPVKPGVELSTSVKIAP